MDHVTPPAQALSKQELLAHASIGLEADLIVISTQLLARGWMLATAESCTGGLIAAACTDLAGSSQWFERGLVSYSNAAKTELLGVPAALIAEHGAVSDPVVRAMAEGALAHSHAQVSVAVTGIAGPGGGSADKPVGTVWLGWCLHGQTHHQLHSELMHFPGDRAAVRQATLRYALAKLAGWLAQPLPADQNPAQAQFQPQPQPPTQAATSIPAQIQHQTDALQRLTEQNQALQRQLEEQIQALQQKKTLYHQLTEDTQDVLWQTDSNLHITYICPADERWRGFKAEEVVGRHVFEMFTEEGIAIVQQKIQARLLAEESGAEMGFSIFEVQHLCKDGQLLWGEVLAKPDRDAQGNIIGYHGITRETTQRKLLQDQVHDLAFYDPLTQLANRRLLIDHLSQALLLCQRQRSQGALLFLDLDNFKSLNDAHGHGAGDLLLIEVAQRLKTCVRSIDTVARFGGDEFVVLLSLLSSEPSEANAQTRAIAEKIRASLAQPYQITLACANQPPITVEHHCSASIGALLFDGHNTDPHEQLHQADAAMYQAKKEGRNRVCFEGDPTHPNPTALAQPRR